MSIAGYLHGRFLSNKAVEDKSEDSNKQETGILSVKSGTQNTTPSTDLGTNPEHITDRTSKSKSSFRYKGPSSTKAKGPQG